jgi:WD40 repeat protein
MFEFTPDGSGVATFSGAYDPNQRVLSEFQGTLTVWNFQSGERIGEPLTWDALLPPRVITPDGRWWVLGPTAKNAQQPRILDLVSRRMESADLGRVDAFPGGPISPDGRLIVFETSRQGTLAVWDREARRVTGSLRGVHSPIAFSSDSKMFAAGGELDGYAAVRIFEVETLREIACLRGEKQELVARLLFGHDGDFVIASMAREADKSSNAPWILRCWEIKSGQERYSVPWTYHKHFALLPDGETLLLGRNESNDNRLEWRELTSGRVLRTEKLRDVILRPSFWDRGMSRDGLRLVISQSAVIPGKFEDWADRHRITWPFERAWDKIESSAYDVKSGEWLGTIPASEPRWSPDGSTLATPMNKKPPYSAIGIWHIPPQKPLAWFSLGAVLIGLPVALLARWRVRRYPAHNAS